MIDFSGSVTQEVIDAWNHVLDESTINTIFITPDWQSIWYKRFVSEKPVEIVTIKENDEPLGILPMLIDKNQMTFIGDPNLYDYMDFPIVFGREERFFELGWKHLINLNWDVINLNSIPETSPTIKYLPKLANDTGFEVELIESEKTPFSKLDTDWETYISNLPKKYRHELRRKIRRLDSTVEYVQYEADISDENVDQIMDEFFSLMSSSMEDKEAFLKPENKLFFIDIAKQLTLKKQFKLFFMEIDKKKVAACICFDYDNKYLLYNSGYNPEFASLSVSLINKSFSIKTAIEKGKSEFNFLKGVERYKYHLGASDYAVFDLTIKR
tara:strand:+ start:2207 stop:3184 length:978 start_codon:yes stop_codon:yes gene_type:complete